MKAMIEGVVNRGHYEGSYEGYYERHYACLGALL